MDSKKKFLEGRKLGDKLTLVKKIGRGGMGSVYKARHEVLERIFAVKILRSEMRKDPVIVERFKREARAASRLEHPNVVYISDFDQLRDGRFYIVMEYIPGTNLCKAIKQDGPMELKRGLRVLLQVSDALDYAHEKGVIHRDLKSDNIILKKGRRGEVVKILDFGLAKIISNALDLQKITSDGQIYGTPESMAPEQIASKNIDHRVDLYALGVLTYEIFTGKHPFTGPLFKVLMAHKKEKPPALSEFREVPELLEELIFKAMEKNPDDRFSSAREMYEIYETVLKEVKGTGSINPIPFYKIRSRITGNSDKTNLQYLENKFNQTVMEISEHLRDRKIGSSQITKILANVLKTKEKYFDYISKKTFTRSRLDELEIISRERTATLRHAIISMNLEYKTLAEEPQQSDECSDILFQLNELENRLKKVSEEYNREEERFENQIDKYKKIIEDYEFKLKMGYKELYDLINQSRQAAESSSTLRNSFQILDNLQARINSFKREN
ncbi:MAG: serine/threonine-protein kinase [Deltaproteobacteria bacterium]|jgi:serine/threonine protein kinase|nr:serine/threonine-protein kinase [Deltaproteobacteria bacterium]